MGLLGLAFTEPQLRAIAILALSLLTVGAVAWLLYRRVTPPVVRDESMTFLQHLEELRIRILRSGLIVLLWSVLFLAVRIETVDVNGIPLPTPVPSLYDTIASTVYLWIVHNTVPAGVEVIVTSPTEAVGAQVQVAFLLAALVSVPFLLYETWAFFAPGLAAGERRFLVRAIPAAFVLFALGGAFGFKVVVPLLFSVLYGFAPPLGAHAFLAAGTLVGTVTTLVLLFGAAFELPLVMAALSRIGLVAPEAYVRKWRHATVAIFIVAALASDPTLTSQLIIGVLLLVLYWGGVLLSFALRAPARRTVAAAAGKTT